MTIVIAMFLVFQPGLLIGEMFLKNQLVFKSIGKSDGDFRDVVKGPILPYSDGGHGSNVDHWWVLNWWFLTLDWWFLRFHWWFLRFHWRLTLGIGKGAKDKEAKCQSNLWKFISLLCYNLSISTVVKSTRASLGK